MILPAFELLNPYETRLSSWTDGGLVWYKIGMEVPFSLLIIEVDMEPIDFKYSLPPEPFSGTRPQDTIKSIT